ncbi:Tetracycline resistance protein, class C [Delftia tsuruhatensis]|uniref:TCR/Tet family MFS transporter n=1 Tax=Delftia tsuruhatensis TaxID=180282 RepID=UPI001E7B98F0|nr:TCR/Tet family MFS transporter [Delftia tsuruhatensis]CAB5694781.1 Tetracycline resistance protein, class C [Delftia tsuruhatensis]CAC9687095.1 Tetracycline resistance protein, class C [Delftia tsuruhatensis]
MRQPLFVLLAILLIDAIGLGLIMPILPGLLQGMVPGPSASSFHYGALLAVYALAQFLCAPLLGVLSDRHGRRRVLLVSLAGAALDYVLMALAPDLGWLYLGRVLAGVTGANMAVASAYLTDITPPRQRAARFGQMGAAIGMGFIAGPVLGGLLGDWWLRAPFMLAALLNGANLILVWSLLPEPQPQGRTDLPGEPMLEPPRQPGSLNAFAALHGLREQPGLGPLVGVFGVVMLASQWPATLWILYGQERFGWSLWLGGVSLACYGLCHALAQAFAIGPLVSRLGELRALLTGLACEALGLLLLAFAGAGWAPFALLPLFAAGGMAVPALQALITGRIDAGRQGEMQGTLTSITSLIGVGGPLLVTSLYAVSRNLWPGLVWAVGAASYLLALPLLLSYRRARRTHS